MSQQFQRDRSDALREQLVRLPATIDQTKYPWLGNQRRLGMRTAAATLVGATILSALALAITPEDRSDDPSRIIDSLNRPQQATDRLPATAHPVLKNEAIDPSQTRLLGHSATIRYFGAPATAQNSTPGAPSGTSICIIPVAADGTSKTTGCTLLKNFEAYGLKIETPDRSEAGWLVVPAGAAASLESVKDEVGWTLQAPNFLVRNNK